MSDKEKQLPEDIAKSFMEQWEKLTAAQKKEILDKIKTTPVKNPHRSKLKF